MLLVIHFAILKALTIVKYLSGKFDYFDNEGAKNNNINNEILIR